MRCASALSTHPVAAHAAGDVIADLLAFDRRAPDLLIVLTTPAFAGACEDILAAVDSTLDPQAMIAITSSGVIAAGSEVVGGSCIALWALWSEPDTAGPRVSIVALDDGVEGLGSAEILTLQGASGVIVIGDPGAQDVPRTLMFLESLVTGSSVVGALLSSASGAPQVTTSDGRTHSMVAITLASTDPMGAGLGFGSSPISDTMSVSKAIGTMVCELEDRPALTIAQEVLAAVEADDRALAARELALGRQDPTTGELLEVVQVLGADRSTGSLALSGQIPEMSTVVFHRQVADRPFEGFARAANIPDASGALLFTCVAFDPRSMRDGIGVVEGLDDTIGTSVVAGVHVSAVIGPGPDGTALRGAPVSAAIFGRHHH